MTEAMKSVSLGDVSTVITSGSRGWARYYASDGSPFIRMTNLRRDGIALDLEDLRYVSLPENSVEAKRTRLKKNDILVSITAELGKIGFVRNLFENDAFISQHVCLIRLESPEIDNEYAAYLLASEPERRRLNRLNDAGAKAGLNLQTIAGYRLALPPLPEQRKIAEILRTWDEAIEKLGALRAAKQRKLSSLRQKLFGLNGRLRSEWPLKSLSELSARIQRRNCDNDYPVMTISAKSGFLLQSDKYSRDMAGRSLENYIVLHEGEFAYNKGNSLTYPQGCIFPLERPAALVPHVYFCFALKKGLNRDFYARLFEAGVLNRQLTRLINSGVRNDGLLNINAADFFDCRLPIPDLETQQTIAMVLTAAKEELALLDSELEALTRQKRGLMQKLLTGEWRMST